MSRMSRRFLMTLPLAVFALAACQPQPGEPRVDDAWVRLSPVAGNPAAAYFTVHGGAQADRLVAVTSARLLSSFAMLSSPFVPFCIPMMTRRPS